MHADFLIYRRSLALRSGAAGLMLLQATGLEAAGQRVRIAGSRGRLKFFLSTGRYPLRLQADRVREMARAGEAFIVDNDLAVPEAGVVFVHNLQAQLGGFLAGHVSHDEIRRERAFFDSLATGSLVVANSRLVGDALVDQMGIPASRVTVRYPGFDASRFSPVAGRRLRARARAALGVGADVPLIGLVTSGHFAKRGLGTFLEAARIVRASRRDVRFLVAGSKAMPPAAAADPLVRDGTVIYRPKSGVPERFFAALDVLMYPAVFEEYGIVVAEAQAMGVPVVVSERVGAAETLPPEYTDWGLPDHDASAFAGKCLELLSNRELAARLSRAAAGSIMAFTGERYAAEAAADILAQKRRLM